MYSPRKDRAVVVYTDDYLRRDASVFLKLSFPPYRDEGAIYCPRRLSKRLLVHQLGLQLVCGVDGDNCFCSVNDAELSNDHEAAVEDAAFLSCWMIPVEREKAIETLTVADTISVHSAGPLAEQNNGSGNPPLQGATKGSFKEPQKAVSCIQNILDSDNPACTLLADLSKAFERVNPHWILELLRIQRVPKWLIAYTKFIVFHRRVTHKVQGRLLPSRTIMQGVDMGRSFSVFLFCFSA